MNTDPILERTLGLRGATGVGVGAIVGAMQSDHQADLLSAQEQERSEAILEQMLPEEAGGVRRLLIYPEHSAGGLISPYAVQRGCASPVLRPEP